MSAAVEPLGHHVMVDAYSSQRVWLRCECGWRSEPQHGITPAVAWRMEVRHLLDTVYGDAPVEYGIRDGSSEGEG